MTNPDFEIVMCFASICSCILTGSQTPLMPASSIFAILQSKLKYLRTGYIYLYINI